MLLSNIKLEPDKLLIQPTKDVTSSFSTESRKYDRNAVGIVKGTADNVSGYLGNRVIYDDKNSIDFSLDGVLLAIIDYKDIVAEIKEDDGKTDA